MEQYQRDFLLNRIISKRTKVKVDGKVYYISTIKPEDTVESVQVYYEVLRRSEMEGVMSLEETLDYLYDIGEWTDEEETELFEIPDQLEGLKVSYYESFSKQKYKKIIKKNIKDKRKRLEELFTKKNSLLKYSSEGSAESAKIEYLIYSSLEDHKGNRLIDETPYDQQEGGFVAACVEASNSLSVDEESFRELARNDPWKTMWGASKTGIPLFDIPATHLTENQKVLINWSRLYDNIYENMDCPSEDIIRDDDALDGWLIVQHRKREKEKNRNEIESKLSDKTRNAQEVFLMAESEEEMKKIYSLNDPVANRTRKQRLRKVDKDGDVDVTEFSDVQQKLRMQATQEFTNRSK